MKEKQCDSCCPTMNENETKAGLGSREGGEKGEGKVPSLSFRGVKRLFVPEPIQHQKWQT